MDPLGPVVITAQHIYDQLVKLVDVVGGMSARIDRLNDGHDDAKKDLADHEVRLRALEKGRWPLPTVSVLAAVGATVLALMAFLRNP